VAVAIAVLAAAGAAVAGSGILGGSSDRQAILDNAAKRLGVTPQKLADALQGAALDQIDAAVAAGRLTKEQGDALKQRIQSGNGLGGALGVPFFFGPHGHARLAGGFLATLDSVASYLGLTTAQLRDQLQSGKTLAQIAQAQGKSVDGLEQAIVAAATTKLNQAVANGQLTAAQRDAILSRLKSSVESLVRNGFKRGGAPFPGPHGLGGGVLGALNSVASYLGLTTAQLRDQLQSGKSLAQIAQAQGKSVDGLEQAIVAAATTKLNQAVANGQLTAAQRDAILSRLKSSVDSLVRNGFRHPQGLPGLRGSGTFHGFGFRRFDRSAPAVPAAGLPIF
jgi:urease accessory protein UreF